MNNKHKTISPVDDSITVERVLADQRQIDQAAKQAVEAQQ